MNSHVSHVRILLVLMAACIAGCSGSSGPKRFPVEGSVTLDGQPLETGTVFFVSHGGATGTSADIKDGRFAVDEKSGLALGTYRVEIMSTRKTGQKESGAGAGGQVDVTEQVIPARYNTQTELEAVVEDKDMNRFEFELLSR